MSLNVLPWNLFLFFSALLEKYQVSKVPRELGRKPGLEEREDSKTQTYLRD